MKLRTILITLSLSLCSVAVMAQREHNVRTFHVEKPGTLVEQLTEEEANQITDLTLTGKLNAIDFRHLRDEFNRLQKLDLSGASISLLAGKGGTSFGNINLYRANSIPAYAFCTHKSDGTFSGKTTLQHIILPNKVRNIEDAAFLACLNLEICEIRKTTPPNLLPQALNDSITAIFIPTGSIEKYREKGNWKNFVFIEGKPVKTHLQIARNSSLASELQSKGVHPKEVNFLTIEGKLDDADFLLIRDYMPNLVSVNLSECNATVIPSYTFAQKKCLLKIILPKGLKRIGQKAFEACTHLFGTLVLPSTVSAIEHEAFTGCDRLKLVIATGDRMTTLGDNLFGSSQGRFIYR